jgi:dTDP-4-amino-4,6-dideoxygalactose transaminase
MVRNKVYDSNVRQFEANLSKHFENDNVLTVCNATTGIMGVFYALGLSNSEVITTPLTWQGALSGLKMLHCKIQYAKIEEPSLTLAPESIVPLITPHTKAVFTADFLGYPCRLDEIQKICKEHNLLLIHDAASSIGSNYKGSYSGKFADVSIYSFGRCKPFTTNEGGCIVTHSNEIFEKILLHLAHPERQSIQANSINYDALNSNLNAFAVEYGLAQFHHQMAKINLHKNAVATELKKIMKQHIYFQNAQPNFYKPFTCMAKDDLNNQLDLPFSSMANDIGINKDAFNSYKIIQSLCFPI